MSSNPDIVLNEFGDLSRKARRELLAKGIDPDTAVIEYLNTQSIPIQAPAAEATPSAPADTEPESQPEIVTEVPSAPDSTENSTTTVPEVPFDGATTTAEVFPSMSKREVRSFLERTNPIPVVEVESVIVAPSLHIVEDPEDDSRDEPEIAPETIPAVNYDAYPSYDEIDGVEDEFDDEEGPTTIAEATAALALAEAIAAHNASRIDNGLEIDTAAVAAMAVADLEPFSDGPSPSTGSIPTISNALILPTLPEDTGSIIPIATTTGEIMITESVSLPGSIASLGANLESLDTSEIDVIEGDDDISPTQALAPVSATTAVSAYNVNNAVVTVPRRMSDRLPLVLSLTAAGLAVAVVGLFIAGYFLGIF